MPCPCATPRASRRSTYHPEIRRDFVPKTMDDGHPPFFSLFFLQSSKRSSPPPPLRPRRVLIGRSPSIMEGVYQHLEPVPHTCMEHNPSSYPSSLSYSVPPYATEEKNPSRHGDRQRVAEANGFTPWRDQSLSGDLRKFSYRDPRRRETNLPSRMTNQRNPFFRLKRAKV